MRRQTAFIFYGLAAYVLLQFGWWGLHLIDLTQELTDDPSHISKRALMIIGEGAVFFIIVILGLWKIQSSIKKELELSKQKKNFVLSVTHELKTPLSAIKLYLQTLNKHSLQEDKKKEIVQRALEENVRLEHMIENILTASRIESKAYSFHIEEISVKHVLDKLINPINSLESHNIQVHCPDNLTYNTDKFAFETIISNLIENALKYAGSSAEIIINCALENNRLKIEFSDNGPGVPDNKLQSIFERFVRLENEDTRNSKGTGLGLYIVDQFVKGQHGSITAENTQPSGLKFTIHL